MIYVTHLNNSPYIFGSATRARLASLALGAVLLLSGCGGSAGASVSSSPAPAQAPAAASSEVTLEIGNLGLELKFNKERLDAPAGSKITLVLKNDTQPDSGMQHNWVLVKPGTAPMVAADGISAGTDNAWVKPNDDRVIAHTAKMAKGGESVTVTFDAPPPGEYPYICTFPGHAGVMKGMLVIK
jgi:azurin